jgi:hypothetical protein
MFVNVFQMKTGQQRREDMMTLFRVFELFRYDEFEAASRYSQFSWIL